jgi:tRNA A-37 threonylcarbamoyl transferase component Bud32
LSQQTEKQPKRVIKQILDVSKHIAGSGQVKAACIYGDTTSESALTRTVTQVLLVIRNFQPKLINYVKVFDEANVAILAVDEWVFERDVDRGFLGEAVAWGLILPYYSLMNEEYLHVEEVKLKTRLISELLENLVLDFPELSYELRVKPEYFMYQAVLSRARLFPPMAQGISGFLHEGSRGENVKKALLGYVEGLKNLEKQGVLSFSDDHVRISEDFVSAARSPRTRIVNLSRNLPRALFASALGVFPKVLDILSQSGESLFRLQKLTMTSQFEVPEKYVLVPTASGLVPLNSGLNVEAIARKVLSAGEDEKIEVQAIGGILNDVFLIKASTKCGEKRLIAKRFKDWSSFKWFPLALWSVGTRTFSILGRSRLERECAINQLLHSKGFAVPTLRYVNSEERLVFMDYVAGETANATIKRLARSKRDKKAEKDLKIIERIGKKLAKIHAIGVALGDTKPENVMIDENGEIYLMDFEQASRGGDKTWDIAEFVYYAGHDIPPLTQTLVAEAIAEAFLGGYLEAGGKAEIVKKAANPKYTKVFSIFTLPHVILAISNVCRRANTF